MFSSIKNMGNNYYDNILDEKLKHKEATDQFFDSGTKQVIEHVDFCVSIPAGNGGDSYRPLGTDE